MFKVQVRLSLHHHLWIPRHKVQHHHLIDEV
jgi:hypothetical protein